MSVHWPNPPAGVVQKSYGSLVKLPNQHRTYISAQAGLSGGQDCSLKHNPNYVYSEVSHIVFNGFYSQKSVFRIAASDILIGTFKPQNMA